MLKLVQKQSIIIRNTFCDYVLFVSVAAVVVWYMMLYMLCSQNQDLMDACERGNVARAKELLSLGADANYHDPRDLVSCVWLCWVM